MGQQELLLQPLRRSPRWLQKGVGVGEVQGPVHRRRHRLLLVLLLLLLLLTRLLLVL